MTDVRMEWRGCWRKGGDRVQYRSRASNVETPRARPASRNDWLAAGREQSGSFRPARSSPPQREHLSKRFECDRRLRAVQVLQIGGEENCGGKQQRARTVYRP